MNRLDFKTDPDPDLDTGWIYQFLQHDRTFCRITQKVVDK